MRDAVTVGGLGFTLARSDGSNLTWEPLATLPSLGSMYAKTTASAASHKLQFSAQKLTETSSIEPVALHVSHVSTAGMAGTLRDYQRLLHEPSSDVMSAGFLHTIAFPLAAAALARADIHASLMTLLHVRNDVTARKAVQVGDVLHIVAWVDAVTLQHGGVSIDVVAHLYIADDDASAGPAWSGVSTYLSRGAQSSLGATVSAMAHPSSAGRQDLDRWIPPVPTGRWVIPGTAARAYASITGDRNPLHTSTLAAKAFGFPRATVHSMYLASRALAQAGPAKDSAYRWTMQFSRPVQLPSTIDVAVTHVPRANDETSASPNPAGFMLMGWSANRRQQHFSGTVTMY